MIVPDGMVVSGQQTGTGHVHRRAALFQWRCMDIRLLHATLSRTRLFCFHWVKRTHGEQTYQSRAEASRSGTMHRAVSEVTTPTIYLQCWLAEGGRM
jgi:hypothetical protein